MINRNIANAQFPIEYNQTKPIDFEFNIYLNAGHSGIKDGKYLTAPSKMFKHKTGTFHNGSTFYEGVSNRTFAYKLETALKTLGFNVVRCFDDELDLSLGEITRRANNAFRMRNKGTSGLFISLHSDASDGTARGLGCWTAENAKTSEFVAAIISNYFSNRLGKYVSIRSNKQKNFYVLKNTVMPAVLIENLFFDNYEDTCILMDESYQDMFVEALCAGIVEYAYTRKNK